jgi:hypothetical protein
MVVAVGAGVFLAVDLALATGTFGVRLLARGSGVDVGDEELAAAAMPMTKTSPQHARNPASTLCLAAQGFGRSGPPGAPPGSRGGGYPCP